MSNALVPANQSPGFAQQGSVDWVALSGSSVQFSVAVLSRLSKAGIDAFTLQVGRAICCNFFLEPNAQERIGEAIYKLKRYGSYGNVIWFGFGIKEVVTDLADTEEGLTLVGLCASLSTVYDSLFAAKVLRELCVLCKAPKMFTPALRQWKALVELCAGILTASNFVNIANAFRRLISVYTNRDSQGIEPRQSPTQVTALAGAILMLGNLSRGKYMNANFFGETDCAWLAAFAEWTLSLKVEICEPDGSPLHRSRSLASNETAQVSITIRTSDVSPRSNLIKSRASLIPSGQKLIQKDPAFRAVPLMNWQSDWTTILNDVFHGSLSLLLGPQAGPHFFAYLIYCSGLGRHDGKLRGTTSSEQIALNKSWARHPVNPLLWLHPDCTGHNFLSFAAKRLPEICVCREHMQQVPHKMLDSVGLLDVELGELAMNAICAICSCSFHSQTPIESEETICLRVLAETIVVYLWILMDCEIDQDIRPSITGLSNLYTWQSHANKMAGAVAGLCYDSIMDCDYPVVGLDLIFHVVTGLSIFGTPPKYKPLPVSDKLARVGNGLCVYRYAVEDPTLPLEMLTRVRIVRGCITHEGFLYKDLTGFRELYVSDNPVAVDIFDNFATRSVQTVVQETNDEARLEMAFNVHYLNRQGTETMCWLHLPFLLRKLQIIMGNGSCPDQCPPLYEEQKFTKSSPYYFSHRFSQISKDSVEAAQEVLNKAGSESNAFILVQYPATYYVSSGQIILLYITLSQRSAFAMREDYAEIAGWNTTTVVPTGMNAILRWQGRDDGLGTGEDENEE